MDNGCTECGLIFGHRQSLKRHERIVHSDVRLVCHYCGATYKRYETLKAHLANAHPSNGDSCSVFIAKHHKSDRSTAKHHKGDIAKHHKRNKAKIEKQGEERKRIAPRISATLLWKSYSLPRNDKVSNHDAP